MDSAIGHPAGTEFLVGHLGREEEFFRDFKSGRLHHSWLISGPAGIGKATLAYRIARYVFSRGDPDALARLNLKVDTAAPLEYSHYADDEDDDLAAPGRDFDAAPTVPAAPPARSGRLAELDKSPLRVSRRHPVFGRMLAGGIADFRVVEREWADTGRTKKRTEITVDQIRRLKEFFSTTASEEGYKVGLIDSVDEMNANAANALLKILEEPPENALLLLVCHNISGALATIRSRCRILKLAPLDDATMRALVSEYMPGMSLAETEGLVAFSGGSIGFALGFRSLGGLALQGALSAALQDALAGKNAKILDVVNMIGGRDDMFGMFRSVFLKFVDEAIRLGPGLAPASGANDPAARVLAARASSADSLFRLRDGLLEVFALSRTLGLDVSAGVISAFDQLKNL